MCLTNSEIGRQNDVHLHGDVSVVLVVDLHLAHGQNLHHSGDGLTDAIHNKVMIPY